MALTADLQRMIHQNPFELFGFSLGFDLDEDVLESRYLALAGQCHPDRHISAGKEHQSLAQRVTSRLNAGYAILKHPLKRAETCLDLLAPDFDRSTVKDMPNDFLAEMLELNEALEEALSQNDSAVIDAFNARVNALANDELSVIRKAIQDLHNRPDLQHVEALARQVNVLRYLYNVLEKIKHRLD